MHKYRDNANCHQEDNLVQPPELKDVVKHRETGIMILKRSKEEILDHGLSSPPHESKKRARRLQITHPETGEVILKNLDQGLSSPPHESKKRTSRLQITHPETGEVILKGLEFFKKQPLETQEMNGSIIITHPKTGEIISFKEKEETVERKSTPEEKRINEAILAWACRKVFGDPKENVCFQSSEKIHQAKNTKIDIPPFKTNSEVIANKCMKEKNRLIPVVNPETRKDLFHDENASSSKSDSEHFKTLKFSYKNIRAKRALEKRSNAI